ncbi:hypothetical protein AGIG_G3989 [Arapaima gigas]
MLTPCRSSSGGVSHWKGLECELVRQLLERKVHHAEQVEARLGLLRCGRKAVLFSSRDQPDLVGALCTC